MEILCETSMRHVHLSSADVEKLYGSGAMLEKVRELSQPGQFLSDKRVTLAGPKSEISNVAVLGPVRKESQAEISRTDTYILGIKDVPIRISGDLVGAPTMAIITEKAQIAIPVIIAKRHMHLDPVTAKKYGFKHGQSVSVKFDGDRAAIYQQVSVRVDENFAPAIHLDSDEGNAVIHGTTAQVCK